jgi:hypothetical protein
VGQAERGGDDYYPTHWPELRRPRCHVPAETYSEYDDGIPEAACKIDRGVRDIPQ